MSPAAVGRRERLLRAGFWILPLAVAIRFHWLGLKTWFLGDDFAWLIHSTEIHNFRELIRAIFEPMAQGTIRPWSDRVFFIIFYQVFGLNAVAFHIWVYLTQCVNILLLLSVARRLTGSRIAAFAAALLWIVNSSQPRALGWVSAYNEPLCALFILGAFRLLLLYMDTGERRYWVLQWVVFLLGFGALELNVLYPALAATYTFLCARKYFLKTLPLFVPSIVFAVVHRMVAPAASGAYEMRFGANILTTLYTYWTWALGPGYMASLTRLPTGVFAGSMILLSVALIGFAVCRAWKGDRLPLFGLIWFVLLIAPVLVLKDHLTEYYPFLPSIGLSIAAGWGLTLAFRKGWAWGAAAAVLVFIYAGFSVAVSQRYLRWEYERSLKVHRLMLGVERAHQLHPYKIILIDNVTDELFWTGFIDRPFVLVGANNVYLTPGSEKNIKSHPTLGEVSEFIIPPGAAWNALVHEKAVVYRVEGERMRNITNFYSNLIPAEWESARPSRLELNNPVESYLLGPEWHQVEGNHRWMPKRATLQVAGPRRAGASLHLTGGAGKMTTKLTVTAAGIQLPERKVTPEAEFDVTIPLPDAVVGKPSMDVVIETDGTYTPPEDGRPLGLVFGVVEVLERQ
jgi:hypothetical protein